ncbi:DUF6010 family protein [Cystobacter ferrugineus]|uniref:Integral membrane protein n=1 Tax=Cystobacter ferrugineus TaxID=83449 RepID=A0A1L9B850_9BACT|nr:DUF6010 family protein [Cystobacter ferrugineus]OJH38421.1 hypothetical protein BON30_25190 [Cystobacter ferrugineus]
MPFTELLIEKTRGLGVLHYVAPVLIGLLYICLCSLLREPARQKFNAVMIAGAGAAYLSGGFGVWEFAFNAIIAYCAYRGLEDYRIIGAGWLLHTCWDFAHHLYGNPIIPFDATSSFGCALCDPVIALWCFAGAPSVFEWLRRTTGTARVPGASEG